MSGNNQNRFECVMFVDEQERPPSPKELYWEAKKAADGSANRFSVVLEADVMQNFHSVW